MSQNRSLLTNGLALALRSFPAILWTYAFNLSINALFLARTHRSLAGILDASLANQSLFSGFDLSTALNALIKIGEGDRGGTSANYFGVPIYLLLYFLLVPGTLLCYQTAAPARLSTLLQSGLLHFWRFVRITLISLVVFGLILGPLLALQNKWSDHVDQTVVGRSAILYDLAGILLIGLVAAVLRIYFDLVEVYTVQLGLQSSLTGKKARRVRRALLPAWRALRHNFARVYLAFILLTLLGLSSVIITARIAMHSLAQPRVWPMFLLAQLGLFLMLFTRFWQRGAETVLALDNPIPVLSPLIGHQDSTHSTPHPSSAYEVPHTPPIYDSQSPIYDSQSQLYNSQSPIYDPQPQPEPAVPPLAAPDPSVFHPESKAENDPK